MSSGHPMAFLHADGHAAQSITPTIMEVEETEPVAIDLPDELNKIRGSLEIGEVAKYYSFTAIRGQKVMIREIRYNDQPSPWKIEYKIGQEWRTLPSQESYITEDLPPQQKVQMRISNDPGKRVPLGTAYELEFGSAPHLRDNKIVGEGDKYAIHFNVYKFVSRFEWTVYVRDSKGHPVKGATVELDMDIDDESPSGSVRFQAVSNTAGYIYKPLSLPPCVGKNTTAPFVGVYDFKTKWQLTYNTGSWVMHPLGHPNGGIGARNRSEVPLVHICTQKIVWH
jgi:hypothetical protein